jgi:hypothetical protein
MPADGTLAANPSGNLGILPAPEAASNKIHAPAAKTRKMISEVGV